jgi:predicted Fe-Mo cluster-binding NifX family protein
LRKKLRRNAGKRKKRAKKKKRIKGWRKNILNGLKKIWGKEVIKELKKIVNTEEKSMKIAISADGRNIEENKVVTFCGCSFFLIVDTKANLVAEEENLNKGLPSEVGATAGQIVSNAGSEGVDAVIVSDIGPQALEIFDRYGIKVYQGEGKINEAVLKLEKGKLPEITKATLQRYMKSKEEK